MPYDIYTQVREELDQLRKEQRKTIRQEAWAAYKEMEKHMDKVRDVKLFQFAIIFNPTMDPMSKKKEQEKPSIIKPITCVLAKDEDEAKLLAAKEIPAEYTEKIDEVEVIVVPFE